MADTLINKLMFDLIEDKIFEEIEAVRDEQVAIDPNVSFNVGKEVFTKLSDDLLPYVNVIFIKESNTSGTSLKQQSLELTYDVVLYTSIKETEDVEADTLSAKRLFYLAAQVKEALTRLAASNLGFSAGTLSFRKFPVFQREPLRSHDADSERFISVGKFELIIGTNFEPSDMELLDLTEIKVDASLFQTDNQYEE